MVSEYEDQINITYSVGERSISSYVTGTFEDKINHQNQYGVHFYLAKLIENVINRITKSGIIQLITHNVLLLPYWKPNIPN